MSETQHLTLPELEQGLDEIRHSPCDAGALQMIVRRPATGEREILEQVELNLEEGIAGGSSRTPDGSAHPDMQLTLMNSRVIALVAQGQARWHLAGDQLFVDLDLSADNLPAGTLLEIGSAVIQVTAQPHTGCQKFVERFGLDALKFVSTPVGKEMRLRGMNGKIVKAGVIRVGDVVKKINGERGRANRRI